ncbi:UDP-N-acetylmuramate dehydrogenase [Brevibacterium sp. HMSC07C04]|uniref:UDP-N-acetylmuramate dehydrogenase n=1 Tax=Brevibacterium sp. HMSC07C04 TaxID=1581130 RepID=UPI0008A391AD|nr:UDP-N-acetylmuramate dehydrogenase [Brevibacterium sp. HMSC07C04]OFS27718.1 UDP-N-acetylenolpyruvoylglucosamine reductase [Brevibacterium sp. HMSC07C04]
MSAPVSLAEYTTLRIGGPAANTEVLTTENELVAFADEFRLQEGPALLIGGGSNLVLADDGFAGPVGIIRTEGVQLERGRGAARVTAHAGEDWDSFVAWTIEQGLTGLEPLSGIPGSVGATPIQNVGAYGAEVASTIESVFLFDREFGRTHIVRKAELEFGYRTSVLKRTAQHHGQPRYVVLSVTFSLPKAGDAGSAVPIKYAQLANALGVEVGGAASPTAVREAVLELRRSKGMVLDPSDHDTWSAGSFFTNPILDVEQVPLPEGAPRYAVVDPSTGRDDPSAVKTSAAWLIEQAGFAKGFKLDGSNAALSGKHTLALTNRGGAQAQEIIELARHIRDGVQSRFGITLVPEPNLVGLEL